jgi:hypothetical protein
LTLKDLGKYMNQDLGEVEIVLEETYLTREQKAVVTWAKKALPNIKIIRKSDESILFCKSETGEYNSRFDYIDIDSLTSDQFKELLRSGKIKVSG